MRSWAEEIPYFSRRELACKGSGTIRLDARFAAALPDLRRRWGAPLIPNSVCRSPEHNKAVGGHSRSLHMTENPVHPTNGTMAADLRWWGWDVSEQLRLARLAWSLGWAVGLHDGFIHVDLRGEIGLAPTVFLYDAWSGAFAPADVMP